MRIVLSLLMCIMTFKVYPQAGRIYPDVFSSFFTNMALVNPSYVPAEGNVDLTANYKFRPGLLGDVSTFAATGQKVWRREDKPAHLARLLFFNEKEGPYISSPRVHGGYAVKQKLSADTDLMAGVSLGWSGINFSAPSGAGSVTLFDGSVGLGFRYKKIYIGAASMQAFNSEGTVITSIVRLQRFHNVHFTGTKPISPHADLKTYFLWRSLPALPDQFIGALSVFYRNVVETGALYFRPRGVSYFGSVALNSEDNPLFISVTYNTGLLGTNPIWGNSVEIGLGYRVK